MAFCSLTFLLLFLPLVLAAHRLCPPGRGRTRLLFWAGLLFYAWGDLGHLPHLLAVLLMNHAALQALQARRRAGRPLQPLLGLALAGDVAYLGWYKYAGLASSSAAALAGRLGWGSLPVASVALPLGISFYVFHAISALMDVSRGSEAPPTLLDTGMYITFFPQHIAGPIVRYRQMQPGLPGGSVAEADLVEGLHRIIQGLAKKVLLADLFATWVDYAWSRPGDLGGPAAWLAALLFPLQLYFDFSGYSDMALGLARLFGFHFDENFRHPFSSRSMTEFWRRWHISFSRWIMDYLYQPLTRRWPARPLRPALLALVFLISGLWHGAAWAFGLWGLSQGAALVAEARGLGAALLRWPAWAGRAWVYLACTLTGILFRAGALRDAGSFSRSLAFSHGLALEQLRSLAPGAWVLALVVAALLCGPAPAEFWSDCRAGRHGAPAAWLAGVAWPLLLLSLSLATLAAGTYHPFLYFRF